MNGDVRKWAKVKTETVSVSIYLSMEMVARGHLEVLSTPCILIPLSPPLSKGDFNVRAGFKPAPTLILGGYLGVAIGHCFGEEGCHSCSQLRFVSTPEVIGAFDQFVFGGVAEVFAEGAEPVGRCEIIATAGDE